MRVTRGDAVIAATPVGSTASVQGRLAQQRPRPLLIRLYAGVLGDAGLLGGPARRRLGRFLLRSTPAATVVAASALADRSFHRSLKRRSPSIEASSGYRAR